jgi:glycosyltransferase involved in cell wall biosynthesis
VIVSLGHVIPTRSRLALVRALPHVLRRHPDAKVLVVGGVYDDTFLHLARQLGVRDALVVVGPVPHDEVRDYLAAATVECHDLDGRTLGITTMEAMAAGVPVFAAVRRDVFPGIDFADWPALQIVDSATTEQIAEALCALIESEAMRGAVVAEQLRFVDEHFAAERVAAQYLDLFAEQVPEAPRRRPVGSRS